MMIALSIALLMAAQAGEPSTWVVQDQVSALDQRRTYAAGQQSIDPVLNSVGLPAKAMLAISCQERGPMIAISWPTYLGDGPIPVAWGVDGGEVRTWSFSVVDRSIAYLEGHRTLGRFADPVSGGDKMTVRVTGYADEQEASFDLNGVADVIANVREACPSR